MRTRNEIVYTSESGTKYRWKEVLQMARGNVRYAELLIERATWEHLETVMTGDLLEGEIEITDAGEIIFLND